jgi:hypothetical protein
MKRQGSHWPAKILDLAGVDVALVNAAHLGAGQSSPRFRWVPFADPLLAPFSGKQSVLAFPGGPSSLTRRRRQFTPAVPHASLFQRRSKKN